MKKPMIGLILMTFPVFGSLPNATLVQAGEAELALTFEARDDSLDNVVALLAAIIETRENVKAEIAYKKAEAVADQIYGDDGEQCFDDPELIEYIEVVGGMANWAE